MKTKTVIEGSFTSSKELLRRRHEDNLSLLAAIKKIVRRVKQKRNVEI